MLLVTRPTTAKEYISTARGFLYKVVDNVVGHKTNNGEDLSGKAISHFVGVVCSPWEGQQEV